MIYRAIVSALIVSSDNKVLFGKKDAKRGGVYIDQWHIPGGGVNKGETQLAALKREVLEETGIDIDTAKLVELADNLGSATISKKLPDGQSVLCQMDFNVYRVELTKRASDIKITAGDDLAKLAWVPIEKVSQYALTPPSVSLFLRLGWLTAKQALSGREFTNSNFESVPYDGSQITWRISAYAIIVKDGKLLVAKSKFNKFFDVIGGGVDLGETVEDSLYREAMEEGGVHIKIGKLLFSAIDWFYHKSGKFHQTLQLFYQANVVGDMKKPTDPEMEKVDWVSIEDVGNACNLAVSPEVMLSIQEYLQGLQTYKGTIIEESLIDARQLNDFKIRNFRITKEDDASSRWHLYFVEATKENIEKLADNMHPTKWYAHFWNGDDVIAVFPGKTFAFKHSQPETWIEAVEYGRKLNIPDDQLTFVIEE